MRNSMVDGGWQYHGHGSTTLKAQAQPTPSKTLGIFVGFLYK
jgi:hypothetical protein